MQNYNSKISNFGLARLGPAGEVSHVTTRIIGTYSYVAPEYVTAGDFICPCLINFGYSSFSQMHRGEVKIVYCCDKGDEVNMKSATYIISLRKFSSYSYCVNIENHLHC